MSGPPDILLFLGRLHPLLVHLPIGLILLLAVLELLARWPRFQNANANAGLILALAVPASAFTALCGWFLSLGGGYQENLLRYHMWTAIGTASVFALAGLLYWLKFRASYRLCLFSSTLALVIASHFGGSLTHGSDYLVRYAPAPIRRWLGSAQKPVPVETRVKDFTAQPVFASVIQPILSKNCVSCHGPDKQKGKLRFDSFAATLKGGENGPVIVPGKSSESAMLKRLRLPVESDDHMPPDGKPQPSPEEIVLLEWWIDVGAPIDKPIKDLKPPGNITHILQARFGAPETTAKTVHTKLLSEMLPMAASLSEELSVSITPLAPNEPWLQCNASIAGPKFGDAQLGQLMTLGPNLRWLDLAGTSVTDAGLTHLADSPNLTRLHLERTPITDAALTSVVKLSELQYLDLYGTQITDDGLAVLGELPNLKHVYLWQTKVTPAAAQAFIQAHTDTNQIVLWETEIEQLQRKIRDQRVAVELGTIVPAANTNAVSSTNATALNAQCPVSGKPIDPAKTLIYDGSLVAFCCDDCKAQFEKDPKPFLAKLKLAVKPVSAAAKP